MQTPTIHLNGTSREALQEQIAEACSAIRAAENALIAAQPNARDYYPQGDGAYRRAECEHARRLSALVDVRTELELMYDAIDNQDAPALQSRELTTNPPLHCGVCGVCYPADRDHQCRR